MRRNSIKVIYVVIIIVITLKVIYVVIIIVITLKVIYVGHPLNNDINHCTYSSIFVLSIITNML